MKPSEALKRHRDAVIQIIKSHNATNPRVFGSVLFGRDTEVSDLDILIDPTPKLSLFDIAAIQIELQELLGVPVDLATPNALPDESRDNILSQAIPL